jgi:hypothetical protein
MTEIDDHHRCAIAAPDPQHRNNRRNYINIRSSSRTSSNIIISSSIINIKHITTAMHRRHLHSIGDSRYSNNNRTKLPLPLRMGILHRRRTDPQQPQQQQQQLQQRLQLQHQPQ